MLANFSLDTLSLVSQKFCAIVLLAGLESNTKIYVMNNHVLINVTYPVYGEILFYLYHRRLFTTTSASLVQVTLAAGSDKLVMKSNYIITVSYVL